MRALRTGRPGEGEAPGFHGTTIRFHDPELGAWRSTWIDPPNNRVRRFIGRPVDEGIEPTWRWRFRDITPDSFAWTSDRSTEEEPGWTHEVLTRATRVKGGWGLLCGRRAVCNCVMRIRHGPRGSASSFLWLNH